MAVRTAGSPDCEAVDISGKEGEVPEVVGVEVVLFVVVSGKGKGKC